MTRIRQSISGFLAILLLVGCSGMPPFVAHPGGGRTQAISVSPDDRAHIVITKESGGAWETFNGGRTWRHLAALPAALASDIQFGTDGSTLVATLGSAGERGGIWLSRDGGRRWIRPLRGAVPHAGIAAGASAWGLSVAPDAPHRWYAGTDSGVARSEDNGESWQHVGIQRALPPQAAVDGRGAARSVLALPGGVVLAMLDDGIHRSSDHGLTWDKILEANLAAINHAGVNNMDRTPDGRRAFILKDYWTLLVYDPETGSFTEVRLASEADSMSSGAFVRVTQPAPGGAAPQAALTIWIGQGAVTRFATVSSLDALGMLRAADWTPLGRAHGIGTTAGDLGVSRDFQPVLLGTDGGGVTPAPASLLRWDSAATHGSRR
jgi:hypothetical protein